MDNYLIFAGEYYYPKGGAEDLICTEKNYEEAVNAMEVKLKQKNINWAHIYSISENKIVFNVDKF